MRNAALGDAGRANALRLNALRAQRGSNCLLNQGAQPLAGLSALSKWVIMS